MSYHYFYKRIFPKVFFLFLLFVMHSQSAAETKQDEIRGKVVQTIDIRQQTQKNENAWAGKRSKRMAYYQSLKVNQEHLKKVKAKTKSTLAIQKVKVEDLKRKIEESNRIKEELESCLKAVVIQLEEFIKKDLPFQSKERACRLASIKNTLAQPDKPAAEKYRRVMEALQIEAGYGRTVEVYQDTIDLIDLSIDIDDRLVLVNILRLGRLSVFCQTPDGKVVGYYDQAAKAWKTLPSKYCRDIGKAIEMAKHERTIDLVRLPIGRIIPENINIKMKNEK